MMFKIAPNSNSTPLDVAHFKTMNAKYERYSKVQNLTNDCELTQISEKYKEYTDKSRHSTYWRKHSYTEFYGPFLRNYVDKEFNMLEIGLRWGGSALMWLDYFPKATIFIFERDLTQLKIDLPKIDRLKIIKCNAYDKKTVEKIIGDLKFDIILDDGSHRVDDQIKFFNIYKEFLNQNGIMMAEDFTSRDNLIKVIDNFKGLRNNLSIIDRTNCIPSGKGELIILYMT